MKTNNVLSAISGAITIGGLGFAVKDMVKNHRNKKQYVSMYSDDSMARMDKITDDLLKSLQEKPLVYFGKKF